MDKIKCREFRGNAFWFWILCLSGIGIPLAILYLIESTIEIEYEVSDAEALLQQHFGKK
jgi:hypothetical protein|tara:strand:+ start:771 stop:947 length:177 start_codon:yes stop_codon:yes gene_type:complete